MGQSDNSFLEKMQRAGGRPPESPPTPPQPGRRGKRLVSSWQSPETVRALKILAAQEETTVQALQTEALNLLFQDRGLPPVF